MDQEDELNEQQEDDSSTEGSAQPVGNIRWAYVIIAAVALLLGWILFGRDKPESTEQAGQTAAQPAEPTPFEACLEKLLNDQAAAALPFCQAAVELEPDRLQARHNLGYAYKVTGAYAEAIRVLEGVVAQDPFNVGSTYELSESYRDAGQLQKARASYTRVLELDPNHGWARRRLQELAN